MPANSPKQLAAAALAAAALVVATHQQPAEAHAEQEAVSIADLSSFLSGPDVLDVTFDSPVVTSGRAVTMMRPDGSLINLNHTLQNGGNKLQITIPPLAEGWYRIGWEARAEDGHAVDGHIRFSIDRDGTAAEAPEFKVPTLVKTSPEAGSRIQPGHVPLSLLFSHSPPDAILTLSVVADEEGFVVELEALSGTGDFSTTLPELREGEHRIGWTITSGSVIAAEGSFRFTIVTAGEDPQETPAATTAPAVTQNVEQDPADSSKPPLAASLTAVAAVAAVAAALAATLITHRLRARRNSPQVGRGPTP